jgi:2'-5' RNA ligase
VVSIFYRMRTFIAIEPTEELHKRLGDTLVRLQPQAPRARWVRPQQLHLTLAFLGEVPESDVQKLSPLLDALVLRHRPFKLTVGGGGTFGSPTHPRVLWMALGGEGVPLLSSLQAELAERLSGLGYPGEDPGRGFHPHLTLARAKLPRGDPELVRCVEVLRHTDLGMLDVQRLSLFSSVTGPGGAHHHCLSQHALAA